MTKPVADVGPPERYQHGDIVESHETERAGTKRAYVITQTPLDRYFIRGQLGPPREAERLQAAGNKLYALYYRSGLHASTTADFEPRISSGSIETYRILCLDAYNQYMAARDAIRMGCVDPVYDVVCQHEVAGGLARLECLRLGLDDVAVHFRLR